jgi:hypothetical protein
MKLEHALLIAAVIATAFIAAEGGITGMAVQEDENSLIISVVNSMDLSQISRDYNENRMLVEQIHSTAQAQGINPPSLLIGMLYHESARFTVNAIRCEDSYEKGSNGPWNEINIELGCIDMECVELVRDLSCTYAGCDENMLRVYKDKYPNYHQVSCSYGLGQIMYPTAWGSLDFRGTASQLLEPGTNMELAARYLFNQLTNFNSNVVHGLAAYNAGPGNVNKCKDEPDNAAFINCLPMPHITGKYVALIMGYSIVFDELMAGRQIDKDTLVQRIVQQYNFDAPPLSQITS